MVLKNLLDKKDIKMNQMAPPQSPALDPSMLAILGWKVLWYLTSIL